MIFNINPVVFDVLLGLVSFNLGFLAAKKLTYKRIQNFELTLSQLNNELNKFDLNKNEDIKCQ